MILLSPKGESRVKIVLHLILWHYLPKSNVGIGITYKLLPLFRITLDAEPIDDFIIFVRLLSALFT